MKKAEAKKKKLPITWGTGKGKISDLAGIWKDRDISLEKIRKEQWDRNINWQTIKAIPGSIIITPKEIKAFEERGIDILTLLKKIQEQIYTEKEVKTRRLNDKSIRENNNLVDGGEEDICETDTLFETEDICETDTLFETEKAYYKKNKKKILKKYENKYIAIIGKKIVDSSKDFHDFGNMAERVYKKYGYIPIYMPYVTAKERVFRIRTPFVVKEKDKDFDVEIGTEPYKEWSKSKLKKVNDFIKKQARKK